MCIYKRYLWVDGTGFSLNYRLLYKRLGLSPRQLCRHIHKLFGCSPRQWVEKERLTVATGFTLIELLVVVAIIDDFGGPAVVRSHGSQTNGATGQLHQQPQTDRPGPQPLFE